jgi:hypothetical protein
LHQHLVGTIRGLILILLIPVTWDTTCPGVRLLSLELLLLLLGVAWLLVRSRSPTDFYFPPLTAPILFLLTFESALLAITPLPIYGIYWIITGLTALVEFLIIIDAARLCWDTQVW